MTKPLALWTIAFIVTAASAVYQRMTGPTYPVTERFSLNGKDLTARLARSHGGETNFPLVLETGDPGVHGVVEWKRYKTDDGWTAVPLVNTNGTLRAELPHQPPAGKLDYRISVQDAQHTVMLPSSGSVVIRFKGDVPLFVLIIHVIVIFGAMLLSTRAGIEVFAPKPKFPAYAWWTAGFLFVGGMILGPIVQKYAFDAYWTGWPLGTDLTDNKTAAALIAWIMAAVAVRRSKHPGRWVVGAALVTLAVFLIPHSLLGSELQYSPAPR
jgi:hypothetical protein